MDFPPFLHLCVIPAQYFLSDIVVGRILDDDLDFQRLVRVGSVSSRALFASGKAKHAPLLAMQC